MRMPQSGPSDEGWLADPDVKAALEATEARAAADPYERWAGELLTSLLGGVEWDPRDVGSAGDGLHDLDVVFGDGERIAVEVTTHTSEGRAAFHAKLRSVNPVPAGSLRHHWTVGLVAPQEEAGDDAAMHRMVDKARMEIVAILEQVEHEGLAHHVGFVGGVIEMPPDDPRFQTLRALGSNLRALGVSYAYPEGWPSEARIWFTPSSPGTTEAPDEIADAVDAHIPLNLTKLQRAREDGAQEAHLFLWLPGGVGRSDAAELSSRSSWASPDMPRETDLRGLDSVWVAPDGLPVHSLEIHGYSWPIWQLNPAGWRRWVRSWAPVLGRP